MRTGRLLRGYGAYCVATGIWPFVHLRSFLAVTGPKSEIWLLRTFSGLITMVGAVLYRAGREADPSADAKALASGSALVLGAADVWYPVKGRISPVYLLDAAVQAAFLAGLARADDTGPR